MANELILLAGVNLVILHLQICGEIDQIALELLMKTANWLTFITYEASLRLDTNDPTRTIFGNID
jgi:hypothetical protein